MRRSSILGLDIGSSSVIAGILSGKKVLQEAPRVFFHSRCEESRVEVDPEELLAAVGKSIRRLGTAARSVDAIHLAVMGPAWIAMDKKGKALTPLVTHQDRRSVQQAHRLEKSLGRQRHLRICGCRPFPGGISSTTWAWFLENEPARLRGVNLVGHLNTFLHRQLTGARVIDPSNASFTGLYETMILGGWSPALCQNLGIDPDVLPEIVEADQIGGTILRSAAQTFGLREGTPVITGLMDGSAGMLLAGAHHGQLFNVVGSTDVLALCTEKPRPHPQLLTRALGVGRKWLSVSTLAAAASSIYWARSQFFPGMPLEKFRTLVHRLSRVGPEAAGGVTFDPYMAGERASIDQRAGAFRGITLATTSQNLLAAIIESLVAASAARLTLLESTGTQPIKTVRVSGGSDRLDRVLHRDWPGQWEFRSVTDATMRGLAVLEARK